MNGDLVTLRQIQKDICKMQRQLAKSVAPCEFLKSRYQVAWQALDDIRIDAMQAEHRRQQL